MPMDMYGFYTGKIFNAYEYLGAHFSDKGTVFRVFAPGARKVCVLGDFTNWCEEELSGVYDGNFYEACIPQAKKDMSYKLRIYSNGESYADGSDPYGYGMVMKPQDLSVIRDMSGYVFHDGRWLKKRNDNKNRPLNIYEADLRSYRIKGKEEFQTYSEIADELIPRMSGAGYNAVEMMPIYERRDDVTHRYQAPGLYSPAPEYGTADDLKEFVDKCHMGGIAVILDFAPMSFAIDEFAYSRGALRSFLQSSVMYWLREYHFDGIRMDDVSRMAYWQGSREKGVNQGAVNFLRYMNDGIKSEFPDVMLFAEGSAALTDVTQPAADGGMGFDYRLEVEQTGDTLTLPITRDGALYGKTKAFCMYVYAYPGKKLNFVESGAQNEEFCGFMTDLNHIYLNNPAFYEKDYEQEGFEWLDCGSGFQGMYSFLRKSKKQILMAVFNFSDKDKEDYEISMPEGDKAVLLMYSDWEKYGGKTKSKREEIYAEKGIMRLNIRSMSGEFFIIKKNLQERTR